MDFRLDSINIRQALHGYRDGHRLLACSLALPRESQRIMLTLSDASGSGTPTGFDSYLTGYPLRSSKMYALARTWFAPEMSRPGCVWTHSLLISFEDLSKIDPYRDLLPLFCRPQNQDFDRYESSVAVPVKPRPETNQVLPDFTPSLVETLYKSNTSDSVIVAADRSEDVEKLFVAIWGLQWPSQQAAFSFSTGSFSPRTLDGRPFRLQATPAADARRIWRKEPVSLISSDHPSKGFVSGEWVQMATEALEAQESKLNTFLHDLGNQLPAEISFFRPLVEAFQASRESIGPDLVRSLLAIVSRQFPASDEAISLKTLFFGHRSQRPESWLRMDEADIVTTLADSEETQGLSADSLDFASRAEDWWTERHEFSFINQLINRPELPLRTSFLKGVLSALSVADIHRFLAEYQPTDAWILCQRPNLVCEMEIWQCPPESQSKIGRLVLENLGVFASLLPEIVVAALTAHADLAASSLGTAVGDDVVAQVMNWVSQNFNIDGIGPGWRGVLSSRQEKVMLWLAAEEPPTPWPAWLAASVLRPDSLPVKSVGPGPWLRRLGVSKDLPPWAAHELNAFLLGYGLNEARDQTFPMVAASCSDIYRAFGHNGITAQGWSYFGHLLPEASLWRQWDNCERLRRAIVNHFIWHHWSPFLLFDLADDREMFADLVQEFREYRDGRRFLRSLLQAVENGSLSVPYDRLQLIG